MIVFPFLAYYYNSFTMEYALKLSKPEVGSSRSIKEGSVISATPIATLFLSPPESSFFFYEPI
jgi:hypothetical protein